MRASQGLRAAALALTLALAGGSAPVGAGPDGEPTFSFSIQRVTRRELGRSWRPGCPVPPRQLRKVTVRHWGFDGEVRTGRLIVRRKHARPIVQVMRRLFEAGYPIKRMRPVARYGGSDRRSMRANNTSAFNCRRVAGSTSWSEHAFGRAIDINPVQNPYVSPSGAVLPSRGRRFVDRSLRHPAMIRSGGPVVEAFEGIGWRWGGAWTSSKDYQHFSSSGR